jgi:hypothetical protein
MQNRTVWVMHVMPAPMMLVMMQTATASAVMLTTARKQPTLTRRMVTVMAPAMRVMPVPVMQVMTVMQTVSAMQTTSVPAQTTMWTRMMMVSLTAVTPARWTLIMTRMQTESAVTLTIVLQPIIQPRQMLTLTEPVMCAMFAPMMQTMMQTTMAPAVMKTVVQTI